MRYHGEQYAVFIEQVSESPKAALPRPQYVRKLETADIWASKCAGIGGLL